MNDNRDDIILHPDGRLELPAGVREKFLESAGRYRWILQHPGLVMLRRTSEEGMDLVEPRLLMGGEITSKMTILDVINMIASAAWSGELHVYGPGTHRCLYLAQGILRSAWSDLPHEHLGELMVARNVLTSEQLTECVLELAPNTRFGEIVVRKGYVAREQLFEQLRAQMEQIFFGSLLSREGGYAFMTPDTEAEPAPASFHVPLQALLMEGVQRIDEMSLFRERVPNGLYHPVKRASAPAPKLTPDARAVWSLISGDRSILEIARALAWDEFHTTKAIHALLDSGSIMLKAPRHLDHNGVERMLAHFNAVLREIFEAVSAHEGVAETRTNLNAWIQGSGYDGFFGDDLDPDRGIDVPRLIAALEEADLDSPLEALHQALHELVAFAVFVATPLLPRDAELTLAREVDRHLRAIPPPVGSRGP